MESAHSKNLVRVLTCVLTFYTIEKQGTRSAAKHECVLLKRNSIAAQLKNKGVWTAFTIKHDGAPNIYTVKSREKKV